MEDMALLLLSMTDYLICTRQRCKSVNLPVLNRFVRLETDPKARYLLDNTRYKILSFFFDANTLTHGQDTVMAFFRGRQVELENNLRYFCNSFKLAMNN